MNKSEAERLLQQFKDGKVSLETVIQAFQRAPVEDLGFAQIDTHRALRKGFPEVIYGAGKTANQVVEIVKRLINNNHNVLITRVTAEQIKAVRKHFKKAVVHEIARCITIEINPIQKRPGKICILCAGTSDIPVAEEAAVTADIMGNIVEKIYDIGVAGIHRLFMHLEKIQQANVIIVVAGMEGALASVVAGLVAKPVIAVPTSVGYGANLGGLTTLLAMLNSCASGITVVNIDNGFGAGYAASQINNLCASK
ncbi:MAG: nickel pincer cofactor biosynthesis protein LarB [Verrucomicrobiae bacterium]|nr:nickel pincer cofactor biosynthesis protein LarB [Verrucomicrobiae bacterium]